MSWYGPEAKAKVEQALKMAINITTSDGAIEAKKEVHRETTTLQGSIWPETAKKNSEGEIEGIYGVHRAENPNSHEDVTTYAVYQEFLPGESMPDPPGGTRIRAGGKPYLRPSMKTAERKLPLNIKAAYRSVE